MTPIFSPTCSLNSIYIGQDLCRRLVCENGGVCNPIPTANNGVDPQCWCALGKQNSNDF